jgi:hypothetical protein
MQEQKTDAIRCEQPRTIDMEALNNVSNAIVNEVMVSKPS